MLGLAWPKSESKAVVTITMSFACDYCKMYHRISGEWEYGFLTPWDRQLGGDMSHVRWPWVNETLDYACWGWVGRESATAQANIPVRMRSQRDCILDRWESVTDGDVLAENVMKRIFHGSYVLWSPPEPLVRCVSVYQIVCMISLSVDPTEKISWWGFDKNPVFVVGYPFHHSRSDFLFAPVTFW